MLDWTSIGGIALVVMVPLGLLSLAITDPSVVGESRMAFTAGWFLFNFFGRNVVEALLSRSSVLFRAMPAGMKRQDANAIFSAVGCALFFVPVGVYYLGRLYWYGPEFFSERLEGSAKTLIAMGVALEAVDLVSRHRLTSDLVIHHATEILGASLMIDSTIFRFEPGFALLTMIVVAGKPAMVVFVLGHLAREGSSDNLFPRQCLSDAGLYRAYLGGFMFLVFTAYVQPIVYVSSYLFLYHDQVGLLGRVYLPAVTILFMTVDSTYIMTVWKKMRKARKLAKSFVVTPRV